MKRIGFLLTVLWLIATAVHADEVFLKGFSQMWFSWADTHADEGSTYGFALKRVHIMPYGSFGKNVTWLIHVGYEGHPGVKLLDAYLEFSPSRTFHMTLGQFPAPGAPFRSTTNLDFVQRAPITQAWGGMSGLFSWRALGVQVRGEVLAGRIHYAVMLANPQTLNGYFTPGNKDALYTNSNEGLHVWGRLEVKPLAALSVGTFLGSGEQRDGTQENAVATSSYGFSAEYHGADGLYLMGEYLSGEKDAGKYSGWYATAGYRLKKMEPILRYDIYVPADGQADAAGVERYGNLTLGINVYLNTSIKLQVNYIARGEKGADYQNNLFYIHLQYVFNSK